MLQTKTNRTIGILGGTFDPIHLGHLTLATQMQKEFNLDHIRIIPCYRNGDKPQPIASNHQRINMIKRAIAHQHLLQFDDIEIQRQRVSYTLETLQALKLKFPYQPLAFILGMDTFLSLPTWHKWEEIFTYAHLLLANRPNYHIPTPSLSQEILTAKLEPNHAMVHWYPNGKIFLANFSLGDISSAQIRQLLRYGCTPRHLLPDPVHNFIQQNKIYQPQQFI